MVSSGSFGGATVTIDGKNNIAIICPIRGQGTICELAAGRALTLEATSSGISINALQIEGLLTLSATGNNYFTNVQPVGGITITAGAVGSYFFNSCEISGLITVPNTFAGLLVFTQCNFDGATFSLLNPSPLQVQFGLCVNLPVTRPTNATYGSSNVDSTQQITLNTKYINVNGSVGAIGQYLTSNGASTSAIWSDGTLGGNATSNIDMSGYKLSTNEVVVADTNSIYTSLLKSRQDYSLSSTTDNTLTIASYKMPQQQAGTISKLASGTQVTSSNGVFVVGDIGKSIVYISAAGSLKFVGTITSYTNPALVEVGFPITSDAIVSANFFIISAQTNLTPALSFLNEDQALLQYQATTIASTVKCSDEAVELKIANFSNIPTINLTSAGLSFVDNAKELTLSNDTLNFTSGNGTVGGLTNVVTKKVFAQNGQQPDTSLELFNYSAIISTGVATLDMTTATDIATITYLGLNAFAADFSGTEGKLFFLSDGAYMGSILAVYPTAPLTANQIKLSQVLAGATLTSQDFYFPDTVTKAASIVLSQYKSIIMVPDNSNEDAFLLVKRTGASEVGLTFPTSLNPQIYPYTPTLTEYTCSDTVQKTVSQVMNASIILASVVLLGSNELHLAVAFDLLDDFWCYFRNLSAAGSDIDVYKGGTSSGTGTPVGTLYARNGADHYGSMAILKYTTAGGGVFTIL